jgi:AraC family transcriptional regulator
VDDAVARVITVMHERFEEPLALADLAKAALLSPFHFSRLFRRDTGVSPGRFLTAIRLYEAKRMLLTTSWNVADISCRVGYSSVGTFTTRFTNAVGTPPTLYRRLPEEGLLAVAKSFRRLPESTALMHVDKPQGALPRPIRSTHGTVTGSIRIPAGWSAGPTFVGAFDGPIPQRHPSYCQLQPSATPWRLNQVAAGTWNIMALVEVRQQDGTDPSAATDVPFLVGASGPVSVQPGTVTTADIWMREPRPTDPPLLLILPIDKAAA